MPRKIPLTALNILRQMEVIYRKTKYPGNPYVYPDKKLNDNSANGIMKCVERFHFLIGGLAERVHTQGRRIDNREIVTDVIGRQYTIGSEQYIPTTGRKGTADMSIVYNGLNAKVEVKYGKDRQSKDQIKYQQDIERAGGVYIIIKSIEDYFIWFSATFGRPELMQQSITSLRSK